MHKLTTEFNTAEPFSNGYIWFLGDRYRFHEILLLVGVGQCEHVFTVSYKPFTSLSRCRTRSRLWLIYIGGDGLQCRLSLGFLSYAEIGSRDLSPSLSNVECSAYYNVAIGFGIRIRVHLRQCK